MGDAVEVRTVRTVRTVRDGGGEERGINCGNRFHPKATVPVGA